jgi:hypothetical protein
MDFKDLLSDQAKDQNHIHFRAGHPIEIFISSTPFFSDIPLQQCLGGDQNLHRIQSDYTSILWTFPVVIKPASARCFHHPEDMGVQQLKIVCPAGMT